MRKMIPFVVACLAVLFVIGVAQTAPPLASDDVIAVTKAQWAAELKKDIGGYSKNIAEDYTEFNGDYPVRLDGKPINVHLTEGGFGSSSTTVSQEMANEKVQVYGDVAILTYNFIGANKDKDGKITPERGKSTRVYVKKDGQWWLVHAHFSPV